jgi:hypothetical protein
MIIPALIIAGVILSVVTATVLVLNLIRAPLGSEDEQGFHRISIKETGAAPSRYYTAKTAHPHSASSTKPFKRHIPAA